MVLIIMFNFKTRSYFLSIRKIETKILKSEKANHANMMNQTTTNPVAAIETTVHTKNENGEDVPSHGYFSYAHALQKQDGIKTVISPMMHVNLTPEEIQQQQSQQQQESLRDQIESLLAQMVFTSRFIGRCMFDGKDYDDHKIIGRYMVASESVYEKPGGMMLYAEANEILSHFADFEFILEYGLVPYENIWEDTDIRCKVLSNLNLRRSSGKIQKALSPLFKGFRYSKTNQKMYVPMCFNNEDSESVAHHKKYSKNSITGEYYWNSDPTEFQKGVYLKDFLEQNPQIDVFINFENPLTKYKTQADIFTHVNPHRAQELIDLNKDYCKRLTKFAEEKILPSFEGIDSTRYSISVYQV